MLLHSMENENYHSVETIHRTVVRNTKPVHPASDVRFSNAYPDSGGRPTKTGIEGKKFGRRHELKFGRAFGLCRADSF